MLHELRGNSDDDIFNGAGALIRAHDRRERWGPILWEYQGIRAWARRCATLIVDAAWRDELPISHSRYTIERVQRGVFSPSSLAGPLAVGWALDQEFGEVCHRDYDYAVVALAVKEHFSVADDEATTVPRRAE